MAGTRFIVQVVVFVHLTLVIMVSVYIGFCHYDYQPSNKHLPLVPDLEMHQQYDPLCPLKYIFPNKKTNDDSSRSLIAAKSSSPTKLLSLQYLLVFEEGSDLSYWSSQLSKEWKFPSYIEELQSIDITKSIDWYIVPSRLDKNEQLLSSTVQEIWNSLQQTIIRPKKLLQQESANVKSSLLILYIPTSVGSDTKEDEEITIKNNETKEQEVDNSPPFVWSFEISDNDINKENSDDRKSTTSSWILIPSTIETNGQLGILIEEWMKLNIAKTFQSQRRLNSQTTPDLDFWLIIKEEWKQQTLELYKKIDQIMSPSSQYYETIFQQVERMFSNNEEVSNTNYIEHLQTNIANWQHIYKTILFGAENDQLVLNQTKIDPMSSTRFIPDFPIEHYAAIFLPLLFPLVLPFFISTIKEYKRMKQKQKEKTTKSGEDDTATETTKEKQN